MKQRSAAESRRRAAEAAAERAARAEEGIPEPLTLTESADKILKLELELRQVQEKAAEDTDHLLKVRKRSY